MEEQQEATSTRQDRWDWPTGGNAHKFRKHRAASSNNEKKQARRPSIFVLKSIQTHLWVRVFTGKMSKVTEDLALHVVFQGGKPAAGLLVHRVVQLQKLHQLLSLHLMAQS